MTSKPTGIFLVVHSSTIFVPQFDSPIVSIWQADRSADSGDPEVLKQVDIFSGSQWVWGSESHLSPSIYLGMHEKQLYIQESLSLHKMLDTTSKRVVHAPKFPWQPYPALSKISSFSFNVFI